MKQKYLSLFIVISCYLSFLSIDFLNIGSPHLSNVLRYIGLVTCALCSFKGNSNNLKLAMVLTLICDFILLFTEHIIAGIFIFIIVHILHAKRYLNLFNFNQKYIALPCAISIIGFSLYYYLTDNLLYGIVLAYAVMLIFSVCITIISTIKHKNQNVTPVKLMIAMLLFLACDICIALSTTILPKADNFIWLFYLPSEWIISNSQNT